MTKSLTIIDADSICYMCGNADTLAESIEKADSRIENIIENTKADYIALFISKGKYFRHQISSDYKANRTGTPPKWMRSIKGYLEDKYRANWMPNVEADDLVAYWMNRKIILYDDGFIHDKESSFHTKERDLNLIMSAIDKDLIKSIPGIHWNFTYKDDKQLGWWEETDQTYADNFIWLQMLMGDNSDGIVGIPGVGQKKAEKFLQNKPPDLSYMEFVLRKYTQHFGITNGIYEFQKNYRLLYMLKNKEDFIREVGVLPEFPNIITVKKDNEKNRNF